MRIAFYRSLEWSKKSEMGFNLKTFLLLACGFASSGLLYSDSSDPFIVNMPRAYSLDEGALQIGADLRYIDIDTAKPFGISLGNQASGVGRYGELGTGIRFGLTSKWNAFFRSSLGDFSYNNKDIEIGSQDFRLSYTFASPKKNKKSSVSSAIEGSWKRHSANKLKVNGVEQSTSNILHDNGWGLRLNSTKHSSSTDWHGTLGYQKYNEDGNGGQQVFDFGLGFTHHWNTRYQLDFQFSQKNIRRKIGKIIVSEKDTNRSLEMILLRHLSPAWALSFGGKYSDNLFRGELPFLDREVDRLNFSKYGYLSIGFIFRHRYSK